ncbi:hypothetical protein D7Z54_20770 [Salibacterium salarium]|uniref:Uncharacterized protein n=1 Tax=Salibacterium salarium TaxID=284579 RepID=A0A428MZ95_9BACI|nr:hypothetical protein [Salibacterium salarium]RSL31473.1 hypothetical protein D7Z54_20770 [Salibacterium salarium]
MPMYGKIKIIIYTQDELVTPGLEVADGPLDAKDIKKWISTHQVDKRMITFFKQQKLGLKNYGCTVSYML